MYAAYRYPAEIISHTVWLYFRFTLSFRRCAGPFIEELMAARGIDVAIKLSANGARSLDKNILSLANC